MGQDALVNQEQCPLPATGADHSLGKPVLVVVVVVVEVAEGGKG